jgi:hypothetical protein
MKSINISSISYCCINDNIFALGTMHASSMGQEYDKIMKGKIIIKKKKNEREDDDVIVIVVGLVVTLVQDKWASTFSTFQPPKLRASNIQRI